MSRNRAEFKTHELRRLERDIQKAKVWNTHAIQDALEETAQDLVKEWKRNARKTARRHGRHYPKTIGYDLYNGGLTAVVGPDANHPLGQGGMSFEYGSRNQPPHLDGNRAADKIQYVFHRRILDAADLWSIRR